MNINLSNAAAKKRKGKNKKPSSTKKKKSVFDDDSSSDDDAVTRQPSSSLLSSTSLRAGVNRELIAEQAALRKQAQKAMLGSSHHVIDYDAEYESFSAGHKHEEQKKKVDKDESKQVGAKRESRYVKALLEKAKDREQEKEIIMERKIAKEQALEEQNEEYAGKEKFVTKAYKRKLAERAAWLKEEEKRSKLEEKEDVTKRNHQGAMVGFYNNIMAPGRDEEKDVPVESSDGVQNENEESERKNVSFSTGKSENGRQYNRGEGLSVGDDVVEENESELMRQSLRAQKLEKIFAARDRYLQRRDAIAC